MDAVHLNREEASRLFRRIGWGLIFQFFDFHIMNVDLLPDFIGYILIATALQELGTIHIAFVKAKWAAAIMIMASLLNVFIPANFTISNLGTMPLWMQIYAQAMVGVHLLMAYWLFNGMEYTVKRHQLQNMMLLEDIRFRRFIYMTIIVIQLILYPFHLNLERSWTGWLFLFSFIALILEFLFLRLPFRLSKGFKPKLPVLIDRTP